MTPPLPGFDVRTVPLADPYPHYRQYREQDPVHQAPDGSWYLFRHRDVTRVLTDRRYLRGPRPARVPAGRPHLMRTTAHWMVFMDPPRHTRVRALVADAFTPAATAALRPRIAQLAHTLVAELATRRQADLVAELAAPLPLLVIGELLGVPPQDRGWFRERALGLQQATRARAAHRADAWSVAEAAARDLDAYFRAELTRRRRRPRPGTDLIGTMVARAASSGLDDDVLVGTCVHLLTAGHETTTNLLCKGLLALLAHPDQLATLRARPELMPAAVTELVRYDAPVQMVTRHCPDRARLAGRTLPRGSRLVLVLGSANRDPARFDAPDRLDLFRDARRHTGFGLGIHYCLGALLARAEAEIAFAELLRTLPRLALADAPVHYADDLVFHGPERLLVRPD
ncbi:cytochrome P450 [Streptomyces tubbatahanensis]|uniref:Cytochrome P450 n=1 Tax=Streptomyces tubbatahanensis TaxID=2923272 RepID=A0ABY3XMS1_9ACTN|nr:cytochrome P450 [Streptomyces tubbatahanensis]UNS95680.1 cytochrome P450 [Streptomyces tubbatahanensis]